MRHLLQAVVALALLIAAPLVFEAPDELWEQVAAGIAAVVLVALAFRGITAYVQGRKPRVFLDSVLPDKHRDVDVESTVAPTKRKDS
jgi:hypothetical protein